MRLLVFLVLVGAAAADVVVLKDGSRVPGRVVEKAAHVEVTTPGMGLRTFLKEEVEKIVKDPKEFLGDSDARYEDAKKDFEKVLALTSPAEQNAVLKEAIVKISVARDAYAATLDLFPDDDKIGKRLMKIMQLMRLMRDRFGSEIAKRPSETPATPTSPAFAPATMEADDALAVLRDPAKRNVPARRAAARSDFQAQRTNDLAMAALLFLAKSDAEMKLEGAALRAVQDYFGKPWLTKPCANQHLEAAKYLAELRKTAPGAVDALFPFALVHASSATPGPDTEKAARALGLVVLDGKVGTAEGHAVADMNGWMASGDFDLAVLAFVHEHRATDTANVRFVWSYALLRLVTVRKRGFERPVDALARISTSDPVFRDHVAALGQSIKAAGSCGPCLGDGKLRCTNCHGRKETRFLCQKCKGKGHTISSLGAQLVCGPCKASGIERIVRCEKCKDGYFDCKQCDKKPRPAPALGDILSASVCGACEGRGLAFRKAAVPCRSCMGLGQLLVPKSDPAKVLP